MKLFNKLFAGIVITVVAHQGISAARAIFYNNSKNDIKVVYLRERKTGDQKKEFVVRDGATKSIFHRDKPIKNIQLFNDEDKEIAIPEEHQTIDKDAFHRFILDDKRNIFTKQNEKSRNTKDVVKTRRK